MKKTVIFNQKVAGYLMLKGFVLKGIELSHHNKNMNVFIFNSSEEIKDQISKYCKGSNTKEQFDDWVKNN